MDRSGRIPTVLFFVALSAATSLPTVALGSGAIQFGTPLRLPIPGSEFADMNGAGGPDALSAAGADVLVRLNEGGPSFGDPVSIAMAPAGDVITFAFADLNGDGRRDLAATTTANQLVVRLSLGWPSFGAAATRPLAFTGNGILAADLDGDQRPEIVVSHADSGKVSVYSNAGNGSFGPAVVHDVLGPSPYPWGHSRFRDLVVGRFDGVTGLDVAILGHDLQRHVAVLLNPGSGLMSAPVLSSAFFGPQQNAAAGDLDGDGLDDLAIGSEEFCGVLHATGSGHFAPLDSVLAYNGSWPRPAIADLDSDGTPELIAFSRGAASREYGSSFVMVRSGYGPGHSRTRQEYLTGVDPIDLGVADFDEDGDVDVLALTHGRLGWGDWNSPDGEAARFYRNRGDGLLDGFRNFAPLGINGGYADRRWLAGNSTIGAPADLFRGHDGRTQWSRNRGDGIFETPTDLGEGEVLKATDLNHDGRADLVLDLSDVIGVRLTTGDAIWGSPATYEGGDFLGLADFDGDGEIDLAQLDLTRRVWIRPGSAAGEFGPASITEAVIPSFAFVDFGDLDGDGRAEIVVCPSSAEADTVHVLTLAGGGSVDTLARIEWPCVPPNSSYPCRYPKPSVSPATPGHPGHLFLEAAYGDYPAVVRSYRCTSDRQFLLATEIQTTREAQGISLADFDLDGIVDVALTLGADFDNGNVVVYHCDASGVLSESWSAYPGAYPRLAIAADFTGDSKPDLLIERPTVERIGIFTNTTDTDDPTPALLALVSAQAGADGLSLDWFGADAAGEVASLDRRTSSTPWSPHATLIADGGGHFRFEDRDVAPGVRYGYRLSRAGEPRTPETWVEMPSGTALRWIGIAPNPVSDAGTVRFSLAGDREVRLEVLDVLGRRVAETRPQRLPAGTHALRLPMAAGIAPGIYLLRMTTGNEVLIRRFAVMR